MRNKTNSITIRLNNREYTIVSNNSKNSNMGISQYIRSLINGNVLSEKNNNPEIMRLICKLHICLQEKGIEDEEIEKEIDKLCQML